MIRVDLYRQFKQEKNFWGGLVAYETAEVPINDEKDVFDLIDKVCLQEKLIPLGDTWNAFSAEDAEKWIMQALTKDLAYTSDQRMGKRKAQMIYKEMTRRVDMDTCKFYTNWYQIPWEAQHGASWNPVTQHTFDMAIVLVDKNNIGDGACYQRRLIAEKVWIVCHD